MTDDGGTSRDTWRTIKLALAGVAALAVAAYAIYTTALTYGLFTIVLAMLFAAGLGLLPLLGYGLSGVLPPLLGEPIANLLVTVGLIGHGPADLNLTERDEYELLPAGDGGPEAWRTKLGMTTVGITYDRTDAAYTGRLAPPQYAEDIAAFDPELAADGAGEAAEGDREPTIRLLQNHRAERQHSWYDRAADTDNVLVRLPAVLKPFRDVAGIRIAIAQYMASLEEHGGDQGGLDALWLMLMMLVFLLVGAGMGWVYVT